MKNKKTNLLVQVTQEHIQRAIRCDGSRCMISEAVKDAAGDLNWNINRVKTDMSTIRFTDPEKNKRYIFFTPHRARAALILFDAGKEPKPFSFILHRHMAAQVIDKTNVRQTQRIRQGATAFNGKVPTIAKTPTVIGGKAFPISPSSSGRMFGFCGMSKELMQSMMA